MAAKSQNPEIQALISRSQSARENLGNAAERLQSALNAPARMRDSMRSHPGRWLAGATASGLVASRLFLRRRKPAKIIRKKSIAVSLLMLAVNAAMPVVKIWLLAQIKAYLSRRIADAPRHHF